MMKHRIKEFHCFLDLQKTLVKVFELLVRNPVVQPVNLVV
jgi:hypothetical protein